MLSEHFPASLKEGMDYKQLNWHDPAGYCRPAELSQLQEEVDILHSCLTAQQQWGQNLSMLAYISFYNRSDENPSYTQLSQGWSWPISYKTAAPLSILLNCISVICPSLQRWFSVLCAHYQDLNVSIWPFGLIWKRLCFPETADKY